MLLSSLLVLKHTVKSTGTVNYFVSRCLVTKKHSFMTKMIDYIINILINDLSFTFQRDVLEKKLSETREQLSQIKSSWSDKISQLEDQVFGNA